MAYSGDYAARGRSPAFAVFSVAARDNDDALSGQRGAGARTLVGAGDRAGDGAVDPSARSRGDAK